MEVLSSLTKAVSVSNLSAPHLQRTFLDFHLQEYFAEEKLDAAQFAWKRKVREEGIANSACMHMALFI